METVSDIIEKLSKNQNILHDNILFYGSSGGGFASICLGTLIKGSKVLVNNSQFFILNYKKWHIGNLFNILYDEFSGLSKSDIIEKINYRLDVVELFKKCEYAPMMHYYVNLESKRDVYDQCIPFIKEAKKLDFSDNLAVFLYREKSSEPHSPLPNDVTVDIIKSFSQTYLYNNEENSDNTSANNNLNNYNLLNNRISELKDQINVLRNDIFQNNDNAAERNSFNSYKQELEQRLSEKEDLIYEKEKELIQKDNEITRMENLLTFKSKKLAEKENQINELLIKLTSR